MPRPGGPTPDSGADSDRRYKRSHPKFRHRDNERPAPARLPSPRSLNCDAGSCRRQGVWTDETKVRGRCRSSHWPALPGRCRARRSPTQGPARSAVDGKLAPSVGINSLWVIMAGVLRDVHAGRLRLPRDRLLEGQERRHGGREDPHQLLDRRRSAGGRAGSRSRSAPGQRRSATTEGSSSPTSVHAATADGCRPRLPGDVALRRDDRVEVLLPVRLLRRLAGDRLGDDAGADQVRRLRHLRDRLHHPDLPDRRPLGVRRRLPADR